MEEYTLTESEHGKHLIANITGAQHLTDCQKCAAFLSELLRQFEVEVLTTSHHVFDNNSFTLVAMLAESHIAIHTWPEHELVHLDILICNHTKDNRQKVTGIFSELQKFFNGSSHKTLLITR